MIDCCLVNLWNLNGKYFLVCLNLFCYLSNNLWVVEFHSLHFTKKICTPDPWRSMVQFSLMQGLKKNPEIITSCGLYKVGIIHSLRCLCNRRGGPNEWAGWPNFFVYYMKNDKGTNIPFITWKKSGQDGQTFKKHINVHYPLLCT